MSIRVVLADDHQIVREGLRTLLMQRPGIDVVGEAVDGLMAVQLAAELLPTIVIMDIGMPGLNGIEATRQITNTLPQVKVIALSVHADKRFAVEIIKAGAAGYVLKANAFDQLLSAITAVTEGNVYLCPEIASLLVHAFRQDSSEQDSSVYSVLTAREREILQLLAEGDCTKEIAARLCISQKTVDVHRQNLMEKLHLDGMADLVKYAIKEGLITLDS